MGEAKNILVTGSPGCGKSTLIERVVRYLDHPVAGFFTREIREGGRRVGFAVATMDGREGVLAHQNIKGAYRVGRYGVRLDDLETLTVPAMFPDSLETIVVSVACVPGRLNFPKNPEIPFPRAMTAQQLVVDDPFPPVAYYLTAYFTDRLDSRRPREVEFGQLDFNFLNSKH
jgi:energy-coupling factor transporter ATP-binding protein EcfA2